MSDTPLVIGDVAVDQDLLAEYAMAEFNQKLGEFANGFGGALDILPPSDKVIPANAVEHPRLTFGMAATQQDLTGTAAVDSGARPASVRGRGPVVNRKTNTAELYDFAARGYGKSAEQLAAELGRQCGLTLAADAKIAVYSAIIGAVGVMSTASHVLDETSDTTATLEVADIVDGKTLLGDAQSALRVMIIHSVPFGSVSKGLFSTGINSFNVADMAIMDAVAQLGGMRIVVDDDVPTAAVSAGTNYRTLLLGMGAAWIQPAVRSPKISVVPNIDKEGYALKVLGEACYAVGVRGMDYDMNPTNPTNANLATTANWAEAFSDDHRDVKAAYILTQEG